MNAEYESWAETLDTLADAEEMEAIREGEADVRAGNVVSFEEAFGQPHGSAPISSCRADSRSQTARHTSPAPATTSLLIERAHPRC
ncbi:MAG: hypothetical protein OJF52_001817 [Nitrospira sp.]|jgi:hypothetical protein|nr:MAG: hypothetical protein OJF52_001817 [Nitrospira sp.]